ncbi:hypothetical protein L1987_53233 [Smallanthus sonchifolius]|uniref:Uncharacterized protein n=1 Tax=Smallanthus sonchifolius TaxID=185202 RepID=A0ACB9EWJ0_9ASTR|nr:hypothetical protein L1987_53233 [Smallanthus sonchifolius]
MAPFVACTFINRNLFSFLEEMITRSKYGTTNYTGVCLHFLAILIIFGLFSFTMRIPGLLVPVMIRLSGYGTGSLVLAYLF